MWGWGQASGKFGPIPMFPAYSDVDSHLVPTICVKGRPLGPERDSNDIRIGSPGSLWSSSQICTLAEAQVDIVS